MSRKQMILDQLFQGQTYFPRGDFVPRDWQMECSELYLASVDDWLGRREHNGSGSQHRYCIYAGTGSGKTKAVGLIACHMLNRKLVSQVVLICPNKSICRKSLKDFRVHFGIDLVPFHGKKYRDGIPRTKQGYVMTYARLIVKPTLHRMICGPDTLVIFDEVHHLGDKSGWGESAIEAYDHSNYVISLTGTPYRSDNNRIPFVAYEDTEVNGIVRFRASGQYGFTYPLGRAIAETVCREPLFQFHGDKGTVVNIRTHPDAPEISVSFDTTKNVSDTLSSLRLRAAVQFGSIARRTLLKQSLDQCRTEGRKVIIFLGGDTDSEKTPTDDATKLLPSELRELGISDDEFEVVTGDDPDSQVKIEKFGTSEKWILISINMVSEGTDIPELSAAIFLTTITAKQTTVQRIGRVLRLMGPDDPTKDALIFMFKDPNLLALSDEIKDEIMAEVEIAKARKGVSESDGGDEPRRYRAEATCISGGEATLVKFGDQSWPIDVFEKARAKLKAHRVSPSMLEVALTLMMGEVNGHC